MAHTLLEQESIFSSVENSASEINDIFVQQFGYTQNGDYYFSPVDTSFGVRWYYNSYLYCAVTFDGGTTETEFAKINSAELSKINYHVSMGEKTIYLRIYYSSQSTSYKRNIGIVIAHDSSNKTVCYRGKCVFGSYSSGMSTVYMIDSTKTVYDYDYINNRTYKVKDYLKNAIFRFPSLKNNCLFDELYGVVNVQAFTSLSDTFINFNGQIYRIVSCMDNYYEKYTEGIPYFAFPVSD